VKKKVLLAALALALLGTLGLSFLLRNELRDEKEEKGTAPQPRKISLEGRLPPLATSAPARPTVAERVVVEKVALKAVPPARDAISGFVKDVRGEPIARATVALVEDQGTPTGPDGAFSLVPNSRGKRVILRAEGPSPFEARVVTGIAPGTSGLIICLKEAEARMRGHVLRSKDRKPVAGAKVEATSGDWLGRATTDAAGRFELAGPSGGLGLVVSAEDLVPRLVTVNAPRGSGPDVEIALESGGTLTGVVLAKGSPVPGAKVILREGKVPLSFERRETVSDAKGAFSFAALPPAEVRVHARSTQGLSTVVLVRSDGERDPDPVKLELGSGGQLLGRVSCGGAPVPGARVTARDEESLLEASSDEHGAFAFRPVLEGATLDLHVEAKGFARKKVRARAGDAVDVALARAAVLAVSTSPACPEIEVVGPDNERRLLQWGGVIEDLAPGSTWVVAKVVGCAPACRRVELEEGKTKLLEIDLAPGRRLEGSCVSDAGGPVTGVSVVALDADAGPLTAGVFATSDATGEFFLEDLGPGKHTVHAAAPGYIDAEVVEEGWPSLVLVLPRSYSLEVKANVPANLPADAEKHRGSVLVRLTSGSGFSEQRVLGATGSVVFERLKGEAHTLEVLSPGLVPVRAEIDPRTSSSVTYELAPGVPATGVVTDKDGNPLPGVAVSRGSDPNEDLLQEGSFATLLAMTEAKGNFSCEIDPRGEDVVLTCPDMAPLRGRLVPGANPAFTLLPGSRIVGRTLDKNGQPQPGVGVSIEGPLSKRGRSLADGTFGWKGLLPGAYRVKRADTGPEDPGVEVTVGNIGEAAIDLKAP
jgi:hypothetical protein